MVKNKSKKGKTTDQTKKENKGLQAALDEIKEKFGEGAIMTLKDVKAVDVDVVPTGCISLDMALGVGGIPRGRIIEIYGGESTGKTTLSLHIIAEAQRKGEVSAFVDAEHALDPEYARRIGVNVDELLISQPDSGEQALQIVETLMKSEQVAVIVVDSVAALAPRAEIDGEVGDQQIGLQARLMSSALRKFSGLAAKTNTIVIFINQTRMKIGVMWGNPETTPGGMALKFYASVRIELKRIGQLKHGDEIIGNRIKAKVVKNKVAPPFKVVEYDIYYNEGISKFSDVINTGLSLDVIKKNGATLEFGDTKLGVGMEQAKQFLRQNPEILENIKQSLKEKIDATFTDPNS